MRVVALFLLFLGAVAGEEWDFTVSRLLRHSKFEEGVCDNIEEKISKRIQRHATRFLKKQGIGADWHEVASNEAGGDRELFTCTGGEDCPTCPQDMTIRQCRTTYNCTCNLRRRLEGNTVTPASITTVGDVEMSSRLKRICESALEHFKVVSKHTTEECKQDLALTECVATAWKVE